MPAVLGEFLATASEHIAAIVSFDAELPDGAYADVIRQLDRLVATLSRYVADLPLPYGLDASRELERAAAARGAPALKALGRATKTLRPLVTEPAEADVVSVHPIVEHLTAAADHLSAGRDLLQTHFASDASGKPTGTSYWAPVITSGPVTAALLGELAEYAGGLARWISKRFMGSGFAADHRPIPTALRGAQPWLQQAETVLHAGRRAQYPLSADSVLHAIPVNVPPRHHPPSSSESVYELCHRIPITAERLRYAAFQFAIHGRWSSAANSTSWRRDSLAIAITSHSCELVLHTLAKRGGQLGLEAHLLARLQMAADDMAQVWKSWRSVTGHWDTITTATPPGAGVSPVAAEISDLAVRTGRLAYRNPEWTPVSGGASIARDPAGLAQTAGDVVRVIVAIHQATDAISQIAATDHGAVLTAIIDRRLYFPTRLMPEEWDIPHPYLEATRFHRSELLFAYDTAISATAHITADLDSLASSLKASSRTLGIARQLRQTARHQLSPQEQTSATAPCTDTPAPGWTEKAVRKFRIRDPSLLLRAAVIDQSAKDLVEEAAARARNRDNVIRSNPGARPSTQQGTTPPERKTARQAASQDLPRSSRTPKTTGRQSALTKSKSTSRSTSAARPRP
jgi:hypothetical protein